MTRKDLKEGTILILVLVAFFFILCANPVDDSPTFVSDFISLKGIGVIAALLIPVVNRYWIISDSSINSQTTK